MHMVKRVMSCAVLLWVAFGVAWAGEPAKLELKWEELQARIADKKLALILPDGTAVQGKALAVTPDGLRLKVTKTSNRKALRKGLQVIPRNDVSVLRLTTYRKLGCLLGTVGAMGAASAVILSQQIDLYEGPAVVVVPVVAAAGVVGLGVAGYFIGKRIDKQVTEIRVTP